MGIDRIDLPRDARSFLSFKGRTKLYLLVTHKLADWLGFWRYPRDIRWSVTDVTFISYWVYKTIHPIVRAAKGSGLEDYFERRRKNPADLLPKDFAVETELSMSFVGDLMCTAGAGSSGNRLYEGVADEIFGADIASANLESTLTTREVRELEFREGETPEINLTPEQYQALVQHEGRRYDIVQLANNHILDCGEEGLTTTIGRLRSDGVLWVGANESAEKAEQGVILDRGGLRIGWVAFTFSVNERPFPEGGRHLVNMVRFHLEEDPDTTPILQQIRWCRDQGCDLVVVELHWGLEFEMFPHPDQLKWAHAFAEAGADVIVGHHPHVPQPAEYYRAQRDPDRVVPIFYSLGNLTPVFSHEATVLSLIARLKVARGRHQGEQRTYVADVELTPAAIVATRDDGEYGLRLMKVADLCRMELAHDMARYVSRIASFADVVLDRDWRDGH